MPRWRSRVDTANLRSFMMAHGVQRWFGLVSLSLAACSPPDGAGAVSPQTGGLRVETGEPPPGARLVGPIAGSDGPDCALLESRGTEAGALADLRKTAAQQGVDFVKVTEVTKPHSDHTCVHKRYRIEGLGYAVASSPPHRAPLLLAACTPPCAAGYTCHAGTCEAECDPPCGPAQFCRFDRVCAAVTPVPAP